MNELVFIDPVKLGSEPFTTSDLIAEYAEISHHAIQQLISKHQEDFEAFGIVAFEMRKLSGPGRPEMIYHLNEAQATLLMTYLKNTTVVRAFKVELVRQFYDMRKRLMNDAISRARNIPKRRNMTDSIRDCIPESPHKGMKFKQYTDLAYRAVLGKNAVQLRQERGAPRRANVAEYLTAEESEAVGRAIDGISGLIRMGMDYQTIKAVMLGRLRIAG